jgi:hypothetical protein
MPKIKNMKLFSRFVCQLWKELHLYRFADAERNPVFVPGEFMRLAAR